MSNAGDGGGTSSSGAVEGGMEAAAESVETGLEGGENADSELYVDESSRELYDRGYEPSEYEAELLDDSYEAQDPSDSEVQNYVDGESVESKSVTAEEDFSVEGNENNETEELSSDEVNTEVHYNVDGEPIEVEDVIADERFLLKGDENRVDWKSFAVNSDEDGFDTTKRIEKEAELMVDDVLVRYGSERGHSATDRGTGYSKLSLPYKKESLEYHEYRVIRPVTCKRGTVAPNFEQEGGGRQYTFTETFAEMANPKNPNRVLERIK